MKMHDQIESKPFTWYAIALLLICLAACTKTDTAHTKERVEAKARQEAAMRMWKERCATKSGVKIHRTVSNVDGIFLMKIRPGGVH